MKNDFCALPQQAIQALKVPDTVKGLLLSPFQCNEQNGFIMVPLDAFKDMIDAITAHALALDAQGNDCRAESRDCQEMPSGRSSPRARSR